MKPDELDQKMRRLEFFHDLRCLPNAWIVIRVDGRSFSRFTSERFEKPFDLRFHEMMTKTARALLEEFQGLYVYTESDEISLLLPRAWDLFDREVEKMVSLSAGIASSTFSLACGEPAHFDSRIWMSAVNAEVTDYFHWRQADATRCALNGWAYWIQRGSGQTARAADQTMSGMTVSQKNELLFQHGTNFNEVPLWQRRGAGLYWEEYEKIGYNPKAETEVTVTRRRVTCNRELPIGEEYGEFITSFLSQ